MPETSRPIFHYQFNELETLFSKIISEQVSPETFSWLKEKASPGATVSQLYAAFAAIPRKTGKAALRLSPKDIAGVTAARPGLNLDGWSVDRLARVWLLLQVDASDPEKYQQTIEGLFPHAEVNELVALYSSLPVLAYPEKWTSRCAEGIRNNISDVLTAIMCNNPYASENLDDAAWNQLVLKAFFTEKPVNEIAGLDKRANAKLAATLSDYAHERWAAGRQVNPQLWRCIGPFINEGLFPDIQKIAASNDPIEKEAAALASYSSQYEPAQDLIPEKTRKAIESGEISWDKLAEKIKDHVLQ